MFSIEKFKIYIILVAVWKSKVFIVLTNAEKGKTL